MRCGYVKKHKLVNIVFTTSRWMIPALPAEPILLTSTLLMEVLLATLAEPSSFSSSMQTKQIPKNLIIFGQERWGREVRKTFFYFVGSQPNIYWAYLFIKVFIATISIILN